MRVYGKLLALLLPRERTRYFMTMGFGLVIAVLEVVNVASIVPFLAVLANPEVIHTNPYLSMAYRWTGATDDRAFLTMIGIALFCLIVLTQSIRALISQAMVRFSQASIHSITTRLLERYLAQPYVWFLRNNTVSLRRTLLQEVAQAVASAVHPSIQIVAQCFTITCLVVVLLIIDPVAALLMSSIVGGIYALLIFFVRRLLSRIGRERVSANKGRVMIASDALGSIKEVKLAGLERHFLDKFDHQSKKYVNTSIVQNITTETPKYILQALLLGGMVLVILVLLARSDGDFRAIVPTLGIYAFAAMRIFPAFQTLYASINKIKGGSAVIDLLLGEFRRTAAIGLPNARDGLEPLRLTRQISLEGVVYGFPGAAEPVLWGLDLTIEANTTVGIVGGTGAGKTTTVDIILGLLVPGAGCVRVDNTVLTPDLVPRWQKGLGYVPQSITLLDASVRANIALGVPTDQIDDAAVERAARAAELHEFVTTQLPDGYATRVGESGNRLSGGQRQRIGIARALYHDPDLLVLDEATSALDNLTEQQVIAAMNALAHSKTVIMIAHRLTTVRNCDKIFFMEKGRIRSVGRFDTLYETDPAFRRLVDVQG